MASVDDIFKQSGISNHKRKLDPIRDPNELYKAAKLGPGSNSRRASEAADDDNEAGPAPPPEDGDDLEAGPEAPPDDDGEDEEGRFFGGGISKQESEVLDFVDGADTDVAVPKYDAAWLRKTALNVEKRITKNAELRGKFEDDPQRFISSEADLDSDIKGLSVLSQHPELYPDFVKLGSAESLVGLLAHDNTDIAIDAIEVIAELTDEEVMAEEEQWTALVDALLEADLVGLLVSNFSRLNETEESDQQGLYHSLEVIENLLSRTSVAERIGQHNQLPRWLLERARRKEDPVSQNKQYSAELLAVMAQASSANRNVLVSLDTVDLMLQMAAPYRKRDPERGSEEEEYMENIFEALTCLVDEEAGKSQFVEAEGVELCLIMVKEGKMSKLRALRLLDHAAGGSAGAEVCQKVIEAGGLKPLFTLFMKTEDHRLLGPLLAIFASMLRLLPADSAARIRTQAKFVEKNYEKIARLVALRREYVLRIRRAEEANAQLRSGVAEDEREAMEIEWLSLRLEAGLFSLQWVDVILAWLVAEDGGARRRIKQLLAEQDDTLEAVKSTLMEQLQGLDTQTEGLQDMKDILGTLVEFLK